MVQIRQLVARRTDLSTFLVHLSRNWEENGMVESAKHALTTILQEQRLRAIGRFGHGLREFRNRGCEGAFPQSVCFTETPLEYISLLLEEIDHRDCHFQPYGIALPKRLGRNLGINPVWYVELDWHFQQVGASLDNLVKAGFQNGTFVNNDLLRLLPFIEQMGTVPVPNGTQKEFWWEREWRHVGDVPLPENYLVLCPEDEFAEFAALVEDAEKPPAFIDPTWGLERIIAHLSGFSKGDVEIL